MNSFQVLTKDMNISIWRCILQNFRQEVMAELRLFMMPYRNKRNDFPINYSLFYVNSLFE